MKSNHLIVFFIISILFMQNISGQNNKNMVLIKGGTYKPLYSDSVNSVVKVNSFFMDIHPVTNAEFLKFVESNPKWKKENIKRLFADKSYLHKWKNGNELGDNVNPSAPVTSISWFAAKEYCECEGKRLPTIAEWEYVAQASTNKQNGTDDQAYIDKIIKWYSRPTPEIFPSVGSTGKNYWGVYDMHGLVWEWTSDFFTTLVTGESRGDSSLERNLFCGSGSFGTSNFKNYPAFMRFAFRSSLKANYTVSNLGFRCVKEIN